VFVGGAAANDSNDGTKGAPLATLGAGITRAGDKGGRVYACAQEFAEAIEVPAGIEIYGGLDCATDWKYVEGQKTTIASAADLVPVTLLGGEGARLEDVIARAASATMPGGSSVAVLAQEGAEAELVRSELIAGDGMEGAPGGDGGDQLAAAENGQEGKKGCGNLDDPVTPPDGGEQSVNTCDGSMSVGAKGGNGGQAPNGSGQSGDTGDLGRGGPAGIGETVAACLVGGQGDSGIVGNPGTGGGEDGALGTLSAGGIAGANGQSGLAGERGKGGGGGGGSKATMTCNGAGGGSGGAGGCGGKAGTGGQAGGSSIGLVSFNARVTLTEVSLTVGQGGLGGRGGNGQLGQLGGQNGAGGTASGAGENPGCDGGDGGKGGNGGSGGGGRGGHALGIAFKGTAPMGIPTVASQEAAGLGGGGGTNGADQGGEGAAGVVAPSQEFWESSTAACEGVNRKALAVESFRRAMGNGRVWRWNKTTLRKRSATLRVSGSRRMGSSHPAPREVNDRDDCLVPPDRTDRISRESPQLRR
jgi:hypothetical protein